MSKGIIIYDKAGGYSGFMGNVMHQTASTIGIALAHGMGYVFPPKQYFNYFKGPIPQRPVTELSTIYTIEYIEQQLHYVPCKFDTALNYSLRTVYFGFQSIKYWEHCQDLIRKTFEFTDDIVNYVKEKYREAFASGRPLVGVHVRRGDYLKWPNEHTVLGMDYFNECNHQLIETIVCQDPKTKAPIYIICSDDPAWCRAHFTPENGYEHVIFAEGDEQQYDMCLLSLCHHLIMSASSMSWWAGYLNANPNKLIFAPAKNKWFGPKRASWNVDDLYLDNWILI